MVNRWLQDRETDIIDAIRNQFVNLKSDEAAKWFWYYNGQYSVIRDLKGYIDSQLKEKKEVKKKVID